MEMLEMNSTVTKRKNSFDGLISRLNVVEERIGEHQDTSIGIMQTDTHTHTHSHTHTHTQFGFLLVTEFHFIFVTLKPEWF